MQTHPEDLGKVLDALDQTNFRLKPEKCSFVHQEIRYLGHVLTGEINPDPKKIAVTEKLPAPKIRKGVQSFLGMCNY